MDLLLDDEYDYLRDMAFFDDSNGYWRYKMGDSYEYIHRIVAGASKGDIVDHKNRNKTDNRKENLRIVDKSLNNYNKHINNSLGRGIYFDKYGSRFRACISHKGKVLKLGSFSSVESAMAAYNKKAFEIYGEDAHQHDLSSYQIEVK